MGKYSTIAYDSARAEDLQKICKSLKMKQGEFLENAISFFTETGIDPRTKTDFRSETNRLIGFIKTQDKTSSEHFQILKSKMDSISNSNSNELNELWKAMTAINKNMKYILDVNSSLLKK